MDIVSFVMGQKSTSGGNASATQHVIRLEFTDTTDTDINLYYDDPLISTMITAYEPSTWTYDEKTVDSASLDGDTWYERQQEEWEEILSGDVNYSYDSDNDYPYCWISQLASVSIAVGSVWRVTYDNVQYRCTAETDDGRNIIGNPKYVKGTDDGTDAPFAFYNFSEQAWVGACNSPNESVSHSVTIEHLVNS